MMISHPLPWSYSTVILSRTDQSACWWRALNWEPGQYSETSPQYFESYTKYRLSCSTLVFTRWNQGQWDRWGMWFTLKWLKYMYSVIRGDPQRTHHVRDLVVDGRMTLRWILKKQRMKVCTGFCGPGMRASGGSSVHDNESLDSVNVRISLDHSGDC